MKYGDRGQSDEIAFKEKEVIPRTFVRRNHSFRHYKAMVHQKSYWSRSARGLL